MLAQRHRRWANINPQSAKCDDSRFESGLLEIKFVKVWSQIKQIWVIFAHLKLWVAVARHNFKWVEI